MRGQSLRPSLEFMQQTPQLCRERIDEKTAPYMENHSVEKALHIVSLAEIKEAQARLRGIAVRTELLQSDLSQDGSANRKLYLKPENLQPIGSFKLRGAYNKIASLSDEERRRGVISYSSRSEEHTSELQSLTNLVCRLLLE